MRPGMWADSLTGVGAGARTDGEITRLHAQTGTAGVATTAAAAWLGGATSWPLLDSLALVGAAAGSVLTAATVAHRAWWTHPNTRLRRTLGEYEGLYAPVIPPHGAVLLKIGKSR